MAYIRVDSGKRARKTLVGDKSAKPVVVLQLGGDLFLLLKARAELLVVVRQLGGDRLLLLKIVLTQNACATVY